MSSGAANRVRGVGKFHPRALAEPDRNLSAHMSVLAKSSQQPRQEGRRQTVWNPPVASAQMAPHTRENPIG